MFTMFVFKYKDLTDFPSNGPITAEILPSLSKVLDLLGNRSH